MENTDKSKNYVELLVLFESHDEFMLNSLGGKYQIKYNNNTQIFYILFN